MSKHQEILSYLEELPVGKRVSVRSISNHLGVSDGTAYRAIKEAENRGIVETRPRSGTIRVKSQKVAIERLTFAEIAEVTSSEVLAGQEGLEREFSKFSIGAMTEQNILSYLHDGGLLIVGDRTRIQLLALENENAVIDADNYLFKNMFRNDLTRSTYFSVYREDCTNEWFLVYGDDYKVQDIIVDSKAGRILSGVSFWDAPTAEKIVSFIDKAYASGEFVDLYWDNMVKDNIKELDVYVEELEGNSIYEIDSVQDYHKLEEILKNEN